MKTFDNKMQWKSLLHFAKVFLKFSKHTLQQHEANDCKMDWKDIWFVWPKEKLWMHVKLTCHKKLAKTFLWVLGFVSIGSRNCKNIGKMKFLEMAKLDFCCFLERQVLIFANANFPHSMWIDKQNLFCGKSFPLLFIQMHCVFQLSLHDIHMPLLEIALSFLEFWQSIMVISWFCTKTVNGIWY